MGRKVYVSFLGTSDYKPCNYSLSGMPKVDNVRFVQEAGICRYCMGWCPDDAIYIFTTEESYQKNWLNDGHSREGKTLQRVGLRERISSLSLKAQVHEKRIPSGKNEQEIWEIFDLVFEQLLQGDEVFFDITHAFRSLPLLALVIVNFAKVTKNIQVKTIGYGAMEALGSISEIQAMPLEQRNVPVFNLLPFDQLLDWTTAIDRFIGTGDPAKISALTERNITPVLKTSKGKDQDAASLRCLNKALVAFSQTIVTCRGKNIVQDTACLKASITQAQNQELIKPLKPLLERLAGAVQDFSGDEFRDGIAAARWCLNHNLVQQGFTILEETMITHFLKQTLHHQEHAHAEKMRNLVGMAINIHTNNRPLEEWVEEARNNKEHIDRIVDWLGQNPDVIRHVKNLIQQRNDMNHAGFKDNAMKAVSFHDKLAEHIDFFTRVSGPKTV